MTYDRILIGTVIVFYMAQGHVNGWHMSLPVVASCSMLALIVGYFSYKTYAEVVRKEDLRITFSKEDAARKVLFRNREVRGIKRFSFPRSSWIFTILFHVGCLCIWAVYMNHYLSIGKPRGFYSISVMFIITMSWVGSAISALRNSKMYGIGLYDEYPLVIPHDEDTMEFLEKEADVDDTVVLEPMEVSKPSIHNKFDVR